MIKKIFPVVKGASVVKSVIKTFTALVPFKIKYVFNHTFNYIVTFLYAQNIFNNIPYTSDDCRKMKRRVI